MAVADNRLLSHENCPGNGQNEQTDRLHRWQPAFPALIKRYSEEERSVFEISNGSIHDTVTLTPKRSDKYVNTIGVIFLNLQFITRTV